MAGLFKSINEFHPLSNNKIKSGAANKVGCSDVFETASADNLQKPKACNGNTVLIVGLDIFWRLNAASTTQFVV